MNRSLKRPFLLFALITLPLTAQHVAEAEMFYQHRLVEDAKRSAIQTLFVDLKPDSQLRCKLLLARIAVDEQRHADAMELWQDIATSHRDTAAGKAAAVVLRQGAGFATETRSLAPADPRATAWFAAAEFWTGRPRRELPTTTKPIDTAAAAEHWLRKIIAELPPGPVTAEALTRIVYAHLGYAGTTPHSSGALGLLRHGRCLDRKRFALHMTRATEALAELQALLPTSLDVPRLQLLIAQTWREAGELELARSWLLAVAGDAKAQNLWSHFARLQLEPAR